MTPTAVRAGWGAAGRGIESWRFPGQERYGDFSRHRRSSAHPLASPASSSAAEFQAALAEAWGEGALPRAFLAVRRSEWQHFGGMSAEEEAAALHARY